eukprot:2151086-Pyramimonas_sp.AAC.1
MSWYVLNVSFAAIFKDSTSFATFMLSLSSSIFTCTTSVDEPADPIADGAFSWYAATSSSSAPP